MFTRIIFILISIISFINFSATYPKCDTASPSLTPQKAINGKWGYVDESGKFRINPNFETAEPFKEGLALISVYKKFGFINTNGRLIIGVQFDDARSFSQELAAAMIYDQNQDKKWGFIDKSGRFIIKPLYDGVSDFSDLTARVELNGKSFSINKSGEEVSVNKPGEEAKHTIQ